MDMAFEHKASDSILFKKNKKQASRSTQDALHDRRARSARAGGPRGPTGATRRTPTRPTRREAPGHLLPRRTLRGREGQKGLADGSPAPATRESGAVPPPEPRQVRFPLP